MQKIDINAALQAHPEFLNEQIDDHDKAIYAKGWNDCNKEYYNAITKLPIASITCTDLSTRLRRAFEADELVNHRILLEAAGAIEELLAAVPKWYPVSEPPKRSDPRYAREEFIVRLESGYITGLTYEFDNSDRCRDGCEPLFPVGWRKTASPVTHWTEMPKFEPPKEVLPNGEV